MQNISVSKLLRNTAVALRETKLEIVVSSKEGNCCYIISSFVLLFKYITLYILV